MREKDAEAAPLQLKEPAIFHAIMLKEVSITPIIVANLAGAMRQVIQGYETMHMIGKGQIAGVEQENIRAQYPFVARLIGLVV